MSCGIFLESIMVCQVKSIIRNNYLQIMRSFYLFIFLFLDSKILIRKHPTTTESLKKTKMFILGFYKNTS